MSNPAVRDMFDLNEAELLGRSLQNTVNTRDLIRLFASGESGVVEVPLSPHDYGLLRQLADATGFDEEEILRRALRDAHSRHFS